MKSFKTYLNLVGWVFVLYVLGLFSCTSGKIVKTYNSELESLFTKSLEQWNALKKAHNNSYEYEVAYLSEAGFKTITKIVVKEGKLISREFSTNGKNLNDNYTQEQIPVYIELAEYINTSDQGYRAKLIDEIYKDCDETSLQVSREDNHPYFNVDSLGIIKSCGFSKKNCVNDCSKGIFISRFKWLFSK